MLMTSSMLNDNLGRPLHDLRISLTDRCNFRCRYCMPAEIFGSGYRFLSNEDLLSYDEIIRIVKTTLALGVKKIRLTGGEPLLRSDIASLVAIISSFNEINDIALTTNGILLAHQSEALALAGLHRVTVSLDALDPQTFSQMNGTTAKVDRVLAGIHAALMHGLRVKINCVVQRGVNENEIIPLLKWASAYQIPVRFIEFMDVGESNQWKTDDVVSLQEILHQISAESAISALPPTCPGEVAKRYIAHEWNAEFGIISSVSQPFCRSCNRARLSADGKLFTCLFTSSFTDLRAVLRHDTDDATLSCVIRDAWLRRNDRYSELRGQVVANKVEMSYLGG